MAVLSKGNMFPSVVSNEIFSKVQGHSTVAKLANQIPVSFNGTDVFTFSVDGDISIVAENAAKPAGGLTVEPVKVAPIKVVYQSRVSDEFMYASEEAKLNILTAFADGMAKKIATGLDKMAFHGVNPATGSTSALITNYFDNNVTNKVQKGAGTADEAVESAIALLGDYDANGIALSKAFATELSKQTTADGAKMYPELAWGGQPNVLNGLRADVNSTVSPDLAIVGDWSAFKWGYAKNIMLETIEYGDPDGQGDLKAQNQIVLRAEAYIGFAVIDPSAFAIVEA